MRVFRWRRTMTIALLYTLGLLALVGTSVFGIVGSWPWSTAEASSLNAVFAHPTNSGPIALSRDNTLLWVVNPDEDTVSIISTATNTVLSRLNVGNEPRGVAVDPNNQFAYVANAASNTLTVIRIFNASVTAFDARVDTSVGVNGSFTTGAEPWDVVISPDGNRVYVANSGQDTLTVIDATTRTILGNVNMRASSCNGGPDRHFQPRGLAVTADSKRLYVARFLSFTKSGGVQGTDTGKEGVICQFNINTAISPFSSAAISTAVTIKMQAQNTGFQDANAANTFAFPNQLQSVVVRGNQAYVPNIAASPTRPLKFNVDTQAFVNVITNATTGVPADSSSTKFLNIHLGARNPEAGKKTLFFANPWAIAFSNQTGAGKAYVVSAGSDLLVKLNVDAAGKLAFTVDADTTRYIDLNDPANANANGFKACKNPQGIAMLDNATRAFVMCAISRTVSVVNLATDTVTTAIQIGSRPTPGTLDEVLQVGKELFFSSRGHFNRPGGTTVSTDERMSQVGWQNCASCHFQGLTDGVVWQFGSGPRRSINMNGTWNPHNPTDQKILNYSAIFDEVQDFELNIRNVSGPGPLSAGPPIVFDPNHGLITGNTINDAPAAVQPLLTTANAGRPQHTVTLPGSTIAVKALDALKEWVRFGIRSPQGALTTTELSAGKGNTTGGLDVAKVTAGRTLFYQARCFSCHGGGKWSNSVKDFVSPAIAGDVKTETDPDGAGGIDPNTGQYLARFLSDIGSYNLNVLGAGNILVGAPQVGAPEKDVANKDALGKDFDNDGNGDGFNQPSILSIDAVPPYYHNGACETLACVMTDGKHRRAGLNSGDPLSTTTAQGQIVEFLRSIDGDTTPATNLRILGPEIVINNNATVTHGTTVPIKAIVRLTGPKVPTFSPGPLVIRFFDGQPGTATAKLIATFNLAGITNVAGPPSTVAAGSAVVTINWAVPAAAGSHTIFVTADSTDLFTEDNETDNTGNKAVTVN